MPAIDVLLRLLLAAALGALLGLEREYRRKPAGLRTNILIGLGSALFAMISIQFGSAGGTPDRIAAQIVTGIGFLGAGAILRGRGNVHGLTTAASVWVNSAIGVAAGAGLFAVAAIGAGLTLGVLVVLPPVEQYFDRRFAQPERPSDDDDDPLL